MISTSDYFFSAAALLGICAALGFGGFGLRRWLCPQAIGSVARLGEVIAALAIAILTLEFLGTLGFLEDWAMVLALVLAGGGLGALGIRRSSPAAPRVASSSPWASWPNGVALIVALVTLTTWSFPSLLSLDRGMLDGDTTWYHMPIAARFAQDASLTALHFTDPQELAVWFYPASWEMLAGAGIVISGSDWLAPLFNLVWVAVALLAAYCIGSARGVGAASLIACAAVVNGGVLLQTQAGEGRNDMMAIALLLACVAFAVHAWPARPQPGDHGSDRGPASPEIGYLALAGIAGGLAASVKLTMLVPVTVLLAGVLVLPPKNGRATSLIAVVAIPSLVCGGFWYVRNLLHAGNPIPQVSLGGVLPDPDQMPLYPRPPHSVSEYLFDAGVWADSFYPDLERAFGSLFPILCAATAAAAGLLILKRGDPVLKVVGATVFATVLVWLLLPIGAAGPLGEPRGFFTHTRYLAPALAVGMTLIPLAAQRSGWPSSGPLVAALTVVFAWSTLPVAQWNTRFAVGAVFLAGLLIAMPVLAGWGTSRGGIWRRAAIASGAGAVILAVGLGRAEERQYEKQHYSDARLFLEGGGPVRAIAFAQDTSGKRFGLGGSGGLYFAQYGFYGRDLTNHVQYLGLPGPHGQFTLPTTCSEFRRAVNAGGYDYLVITPTAAGRPGSPFGYPLRAWSDSDPALRPLFAERVEPQTVVVYEVESRLNPSC